jgi:type IV pilus assembly protein PilE
MKNIKGFTLIELLVVVVIIGILAAIALPQYQKAVIKSEMSGGIIMARAIIDAEQRFFLANGIFTDDLGKLDIDIPSGINEKFYSITFVNSGTASCIDWDLKLKKNHFGEIWIAAYLESNRIYCAARKTGGAKANDFCKQYNSNSITCPCQSLFNCYAIK